MSRVAAIVYLIFIVLIYLIGAINIDLMDQDVTQYMTIARNMVNSGDYMLIKWRDDFNYLDKPPLLFWLSSFSMSILGITPFAYRLPSMLVHLLGIFSTYKLGQRMYNEETGWLSAVVFASSFGIFVFNHDVRTDTLLTGLTAFSLWQLYSFLQERKTLNFVLGFIGVGLAISAKGPIGIIVPMLAIIPFLVYQKKWNLLFNKLWLWSIPILLIVLAPMIISVYLQHGVKGLEFHFWSQSFGRISGESVWKDTTGPLYFVHTFLWSFIPWSVLAMVAYFNKIRIAAAGFGNPKSEEVLTLSGFTMVVILMSMASYKLPHYIYVVFPLISIITARYIQKKQANLPWEGFGFWLYLAQLIFDLLLWVAIFITFLWFKPADFLPLIAPLAVFTIYVYTIAGGKSHSKLIHSTLLTMLATALVMNTHFYPALNQYQGRVFAGKYLSEHGITENEVVIYPTSVHKPSIDVYSNNLIMRTSDISDIDTLLITQSPLFVFTDEKNLDWLKIHYPMLTIEKAFDDYQISLLSLAFLNPDTRQSTLTKLYLIKINQ